MIYTIGFYEWSRPPLTANQRFNHWGVKSRLVKQVRGMTFDKTQHLPQMERCKVQLVWFVNDRRRRDTDNLYPTLKACCDGVVDAGVVPDDTPEFMDKPQPQIIYVPKEIIQAHVELHITDIGENI